GVRRRATHPPFATSAGESHDSSARTFNEAGGSAADTYAKSHGRSHGPTASTDPSPSGTRTGADNASSLPCAGIPSSSHRRGTGSCASATPAASAGRSLSPSAAGAGSRVLRRGGAAACGGGARCNGTADDAAGQGRALGHTVCLSNRESHRVAIDISQ
ncbi:MAG: hypothetical protein JWM61_1162, partial [Micrococcaceae bacterium]|nr:hypothetical protein [Micrococcaceae bacterium]